jgi:hypothetical protein
MAGRIDERKDDSAKTLADMPVEHESLAWPPPILEGAIVWFVNERACISEIPDRWQIDNGAPRNISLDAQAARDEILGAFAATGASRTIAAPPSREYDDVLAQTAVAHWVLEGPPADACGLYPSGANSVDVIEREETIVGFAAFDTPPRQRSHWTEQPSMMAAAVVGIAIALGGSWTRHERQVGLHSTPIADVVKPTDRAPNKGVIIRPGGPRLRTIVRRPEAITTAPPTRPAGDRIPAAIRPSEMPVTLPPFEHTHEPTVSASLQPSVGQSPVGRPSRRHFHRHSARRRLPR